MPPTLWAEVAEFHRSEGSEPEGPTFLVKDLDTGLIHRSSGLDDEHLSCNLTTLVEWPAYEHVHSRSVTCPICAPRLFHLPGKHDQKTHGGFGWVTEKRDVEAIADIRAKDLALPDNIKLAKHEYTGDALNSDVINGYLRTGTLTPGGDIRTEKKVRQVISDLDAAIASMSTERPHVGYRAIRVDSEASSLYASLQPGSTMSDKGYTSVSVDRELVQPWATPRLKGQRGIVIRVGIPTGTNYVPDRVESQLVLSRGTKLRVAKVLDQDNIRYANVVIER